MGADTPRQGSVSVCGWLGAGRGPPSTTLGSESCGWPGAGRGPPSATLGSGSWALSVCLRTVSWDLLRASWRGRRWGQQWTADGPGCGSFVEAAEGTRGSISHGKVCVPSCVPGLLHVLCAHSHLQSWGQREVRPQCPADGGNVGEGHGITGRPAGAPSFPRPAGRRSHANRNAAPQNKEAL